MRKTSFDYEGAKNAGYSDEEITSHLSQIHPKFDIKAAQESGYSPSEINEYLATYKPKSSNAEKAVRIGTQYGIGALEGSLPGMVYEAAVAPLSKGSQEAQYRQNLFEDIENMQQAKQLGGYPGTGKIWDNEDENLLKNLTEQAEQVSKSDPFIKSTDLSIRNIVEKVYGQDLTPEGTLEKAAHWAGIIKDPKRLMQVGLKPKEIIKALSPTGGEVLRGVGAGAALQIAEEGGFGPIGQLTAGIIGDLAGHTVGKSIKAAKELITKPKETLAKITSKFTSKDKINLQKDIIEDFRKSGIQADLGSITNNNLIKLVQSRLSQSGLTGKAFDEFKDQITGQIKKEYGQIADQLGQLKYSSTHEAGEILKEGMKKIRESDLVETRNLYKNAMSSLDEKSFVDPHRLNSAIQKLKNDLTPGALKSSEQTAVLNAVEKIESDIRNAKGNLKLASVKDLINNKIALNDMINYEVQGGSKQLLKGLVAELDRSIISHGKQNIPFVRNYVNANKHFSNHAKMFRSKSASKMLQMEDPSQLISKMNTIHGMRSIEKILGKTQEGKDIFNALKRTQFEKMIGDNLIDSTTQQVKLGTFSKLLQKGKNKELTKEILGAKAFQSLERLQKNAGVLQEAVEKFYNASKSGSVAVDAAIMGKVMVDIIHLLSGNPWGLMKSAGAILGARHLSKLLADPEFLKLTEDFILASKKGSQQSLLNAMDHLKPYLLKAYQESNQYENPEAP